MPLIGSCDVPAGQGRPSMAFHSVQPAQPLPMASLLPFLLPPSGPVRQRARFYRQTCERKMILCAGVVWIARTRRICCMNTQGGLPEILAAAARSMRADFDRSAIIKHSASKGSVRELLLLSNYLVKYLPSNVKSAINGEIVTMRGERSGQCDILIYDPVSPPLYEEATYRLVPAECIYGVIEVKSMLDSRELESACEKTSEVKRYEKKAFGSPNSVARYRRQYGCEWSHTPTSGFIFAYDSISLDTLAQKFMEITEKQPLKERMDAIWVLGKGALVWVDPETKDIDPSPRPGAKLGVIEALDDQDILFHMTLSLNEHFASAFMPGPLRLSDYAGEATLGMLKYLLSHDQTS